MSPTTAGILLKVTSTLLFAVMVSLIKLVADRVPPGEVLFARAFFGIVPVLVMLAVQGGLPGVLRTRHPFLHMRRAVVGTISMFCWFASIVYLPLPDASAINYSSPLFGVLFAALLLGERVRIYRWTAVIVGFAGVLIVLSEQIGGSGAGFDGRAIGALFALGAAFFSALAVTTVRQLTLTEKDGAIVFYFSASATLLSLLTLPFGWVIPSRADTVLLIFAGLCGGVGQVVMTAAYRKAEASVIAPFDYVIMIWIVILSYFLFSDVPTPTVLLGSSVVIGSGIFVIWRERRLGRTPRQM